MSKKFKEFSDILDETQREVQELRRTVKDKPLSPLIPQNFPSAMYKACLNQPLTPTPAVMNYK